VGPNYLTFEIGALLETEYTLAEMLKKLNPPRSHYLLETDLNDSEKAVLKEPLCQHSTHKFKVKKGSLPGACVGELLYEMFVFHCLYGGCGP